MYPWVLPATHCLPVVLAQLAGHFLPRLPSTTANLFSACLCCAYQLAFCVCVLAGLVCVRLVQSDAGEGLVCYQIMQAHLGLHQHRRRHRPVPVKPEPRADAGEPSAQNGTGVRNTRTHTHTYFTHE